MDGFTRDLAVYVPTSFRDLLRRRLMRATAAAPDDVVDPIGAVRKRDIIWGRCLISSCVRTLRELTATTARRVTNAGSLRRPTVPWFLPVRQC